MARYTKEDVLRIAEEENVEFIRLQFTDVFGNLKNDFAVVQKNGCSLFYLSADTGICERHSIGIANAVIARKNNFIPFYNFSYFIGVNII